LEIWLNSCEVREVDNDDDGDGDNDEIIIPSAATG
jgi:hypothetical protein